MFEINQVYPQLNEGFGLVGGLAYLGPMAVMSVVSGVFADKVNRVYLLGGSCVLWSLTSLVGGSDIDSFTLFVLMRVSFGFLSSMLNPASLSLIRDYFPEN